MRTLLRMPGKRTSPGWPLLFSLSLLPVLAGQAMSAGLAGSEWRPVRLGTLGADSGVEAFVQFRGEGQLSGHGGCNRFSGSWQSDGESLTIGPLASTRMACPEPQMALETALFGALAAARSYRRDRIDLLLLDSDGHEIARFAQTDAD